MKNTAPIDCLAEPQKDVSWLPRKFPGFLQDASLAADDWSDLRIFQLRRSMIPCWSSMKRLAIPLACFAVLTASASLRATESGTILDTQFTENTNSLPDNARWFRSGSTLGMDFNQPGLTITPKDNTREALAYICPSGQAIGLAKGETLRVSFSVVGQNLQNSGASFRIGLFYSEGTARQTGTSPFAAAGYTGYALLTNLRSRSESATTVIARDPSLGESTLLVTNGLMSEDLRNVLFKGAGPRLEGHASFDGWLSVTNEEKAGVKVSYELAGVSGNYMDTKFRYTSFDAVGLTLRYGDTQITPPPSLTFTHVKVEILR